MAEEESLTWDKVLKKVEKIFAINPRIRQESHSLFYNCHFLELTSRLSLIVFSLAELKKKHLFYKLLGFIGTLSGSQNVKYSPYQYASCCG